MKDIAYLKLHKEFLISEWDSLDEKIRENISDNPQCQEAKLLEQRIDRKVRAALGLDLFPIADVLS